MWCNVEAAVPHQRCMRLPYVQVTVYQMGHPYEFVSERPEALFHEALDNAIVLLLDQFFHEEGGEWLSARMALVDKECHEWDQDVERRLEVARVANETYGAAMKTRLVRINQLFEDFMRGRGHT